MASPLFYERLGHDVGFDLLFDVHLLELPVLFLNLPHAGHE